MVAAPHTDTSVHSETDASAHSTVVFGVTPVHARRVSVVCGRFCVDITLPSHEPVSTMLGGIAEIFFEQIRSSPTVVDGSLLEELCGPGAHGKWELSRLGGDTLHPERSLAQSGVVDGEPLVLAAPPVPTPSPVWDDSLAALSAHTSADVWTMNDSRRAASVLIAALGVLLGAVLTVSFLRGPGDATAAVSLVGAATGLAFTVIFRSHGAGPATAITGIGMACGFVFIAAATLVPGSPGAIHVVSGASATLLLGTVGAAISSFAGSEDEKHEGASSSDGPSAGPHVVERDVFACVVALSALALIGGVLVRWAGLSAEQIGVGISMLGWACCLFAPSLAVALCSLPLPGSTAESTKAPDPLEMAEVREFSERATRMLLALTSASSTCVVAGCALAVIGADTSTWSLALPLCIAVWLLLRVRTVPSRACGIACMTAGVLVLLSAASTAFWNTDTLLWISVFAILCLAMSAIVAAAGWWVPSKEFSPTARRVVDVFDVLITCSIVPLALFAAGIVQAVRG